MSNEEILTESKDECAHSTQRTIDAPVEMVFGAFSNPDLLAQWWGPNGFTNTFKEFDLKKDGYWRFTMHGPDGKNYPNESRFIEVISNEKVVIEHFSGHHFILTITFNSTGNTTIVGWKQLFDTVEHYQKITEFVSQANEQNLDRLSSVVANVMRAVD
ncbi:SRPBCC family protein [Kaarinaea lacus]